MRSPDDTPVVWQTHKPDARCTACGQAIGRGALVHLGPAGERCAACAGFGDLAFLPAGDMALTRRAVKQSARHAVVVRYSRSRKRAERQGVLVEPAALEAAAKQCEADAAARQAQAVPRAARAALQDQAYAVRFAARVRDLYPRCSEAAARQIAERACERSSGRVGRTASSKDLDAEAITLAVVAHIRHHHTSYERLLRQGMARDAARDAVRDEVLALLAAWRVAP